jgi:hypothetical protein
MDICSFLLGIGATVIGELVLYCAVFMIERPDLEIQEGGWKEKKWVGVLLGDIKYYSTDRGGEARVDGYDFMIYGVAIKINIVIYCLEKQRKLVVRLLLFSIKTVSK